MTVIINDTYLTEIANAIRTKTGYTGGLKPNQFAAVLGSYYGR